MNDTKITLITGADTGMGFEIAKELGQNGQKVIVGSRNLEKGQSALERLAVEGVVANLVQLDVTDAVTIAQAVTKIKEQYGRLDILINNAGIALDKHRSPEILPTSVMRQDFDVNFFGLVDVTQAFLPLLKEAPKGQIINISSMMGSMTAALDPKSETYHASAAGYQSSKAAVNMFSIQLAKALQQEQSKVTVNLVDPGMVATDFGGTPADESRSLGAKTVSEGVVRTVDLALHGSDETGTFSNVNGIVPW